MALLLKLYKPGSGGSGGNEGTEYISLHVERWQFDGMRDTNKVQTVNQKTSGTIGSRIKDRGSATTLLTISGVVAKEGALTAVTRMQYLETAFWDWWSVSNGAGYLVGHPVRTPYRVAIQSLSWVAQYPEVDADGNQVYSFVLRLEVKKV